MKIKILGTRGEIKSSCAYHCRHSGVLIDNTLLFDLGEKEFLQYKPKYIFLTHFHTDHAFFLKKRQEFKLTAYAPEKLENYPTIEILTKTKKFNSYKITPLPTVHSLKVKSQAYLIEKNNKKVLYTSDLAWLKKKYQKKLPRLDLVILEASFAKKGGLIKKNKQGKIYGHAGLPNLIQLFKNFTDKIAVTHFGSWFYKDIKKARKKISQLANDNGVEIIICYDGLEIQI